MGNEEMTVKITDIKSRRIKTLAENVDKYAGDGNGSINTSTEAEKLRNLLNGERKAKNDLAKETDDVKALFGYRSTAPAATEATPAATVTASNTAETKAAAKPVQLSEADRKEVEDKVAEKVKSMAKNGYSTDEIKKALQEYYNSRAEKQQPKFTETLNQVYSLIDEIVKTKSDHKNFLGIKTRNKAHSDLKKKIKNNELNGIKWDFAKEIVSALENAAEVQRAQNIAMSVADKYYSHVSTSDNSVPDFEKGVKEAKDAIDKIDSKDVSKADKKNAKKMYESKAEDESVSYVQKNWMKDTKQESHRKIRKELRDKNANDDSYINDAIQTLKPNRKAKENQNAVNNRLEELKQKGVTDEYLADELQKKFLGVKVGGGKSLERKLTSGLNTRVLEMSDGQQYSCGFRNEDGTLNIEKLAKGIIQRIGSDGIMNRNDDDYNASELKGVQDYLKFETGEEFSRDEVKRIIKFFKIKYEHRDRSIMTILASMAEGIPDLAAAVASGALAGYFGICKNTSFQFQYVSIDMYNSLLEKGAQNGIPSKFLEIMKTITELDPVTQASEVEKLYKEAAQMAKDILKGEGAGVLADKIVDKNGNFVAAQLQLVTHDHQMDNTKIGIIKGLIIGAIDIGLRGAATAIFGKGKNEKTCISPSYYVPHDPIFNDINLYKEYVKTNNPAQKAAWMVQLADDCKTIAEKYGNKVSWHQLNYDIINTNGGYGTVNPDECLNIQLSDVEKFYKEHYGDKTPAPKPDEVTFTGEEICTPVTTRTVNIDIPKVRSNEDWGVFASRYFDCLQDKDSNVKLVREKGTNNLVPNTYTRTMMKVMQAVNDGNYDLARLQKLTQAAMKRDYGTLKAEQGFDFNTYYSLRKGAITRQKMPTITSSNGDCEPEKDPKYTRTYRGGKGQATDVQGDNKTETSGGGYTGTLNDSNGQHFETHDRQEFNNKKVEWEKTKQNNGIHRSGC